MNRKPTIGVMGGATSVSDVVLAQLSSLAENLGKAIASNGSTLITGETCGLPGKVSEAAHRAGGRTIGISAAHSEEEHYKLYNAPEVRSDVIIFTGFGLKGRNVVNIRSSDIVIIFCGSIGTLNEFTIAYDEGKIIGILEGSGGVADLIPGIVSSLAKPTKSKLIYDSSAEKLISKCLALYEERVIEKNLAK